MYVLLRRSKARLIGQNADYLAHAISVHLHRTPQGVQDGAVRVLGAVMRHGEEGVCPLASDCIHDLLTSLDTKQADAAMVWVGLRTIAESCERFVSNRNTRGQECVVKEPGVVKRQDAIPMGIDTNHVGVVKEPDTNHVDVVKEPDTNPVGVVKEVEPPEIQPKGIEAIAEYFLQYHKTKKEEREVGGEEEEEGRRGAEESEEEGGEEQYSQERTLPATEQVCVEVMRRCAHYLAHDKPAVRLVVMETLRHCMEALKHDKVCPPPHMVCPL